VLPKQAIAERIFQPAFFAQALPALREVFYKSFEMVEDEHPLNVADSWNFVNLQPRGTFHAPAVDRHEFEMRAPHTDNDLVDFLLTIPPYARLEQRVYKKMIAYSFPQIRDVPCTNSGRPINPNFLQEYLSMVGDYTGRKVATVVQRLLPGQSGLGREFRDLAEDFRAEPELVEHILKSLLRCGILPESIFRHNAIEEMVAEHYKRNGRHEQTLGLLISLGLGIKYFLHDDFSDVPQEIYAADAINCVPDSLNEAS
jgi:hypothetical protein